MRKYLTVTIAALALVACGPPNNYGPEIEEGVYDTYILNLRDGRQIECVSIFEHGIALTCDWRY